ncbi:filamentous hemagglutinin N-terminal domain-containing protein [Herbaspirillum sp. AP02]|uniref:beta strand repeat-containing protein n=1 Tax=unclassified Herbaspirillum TaxID=2624150 RepID=UPI0015DB7E3D|nr:MULTISPECIES: filamentous hemagglutinin N-terminal domain-containing protein [unclassified Herbaspirillum]MBG7620366.1 filamentous hemagglutinin N-terminal domain-containing protein [Herbaspirillum sp. AP02]NZD67830.1 filamentous hemagglutinin N-terminal domain-containing protein [Herbaspirillum sp. AP21]
MTSTSTSASASTQPPVPPVIELLPPSITVRVGKRKLTLSWRPRKPLPQLLSRLLRRSWQRVLAPGLRISLAAAAVCGAWQAPVLAAAPAPGTLPNGWSVVNGNVTFTQNGNTLNINQLSPQAIAQFASFSIGADAAVNVNQPNAAAALLAKVTGADISQIYGKLSATGTVVLYNPNGVVIGPSGTIDAARFIATSLAISDSDFLAGKLNFARQGTAGLVDNQGKIESATGGSVYLIGSSVSNSGIIKSPQGEVILAAGQTVTLADTATPGVTVNVTGSAGNVTNLGSITAEAGRIGVAAGLITNSGVINASSVVREGGRIFLRASQDLTTTASSSITADGTKGGNVTLFASNKAFIDGDVSATGAPGQGGFVETSGLKQLDVVKVPKVGSGGTWLIDPYDLEVVANGTLTGNGDGCGTSYAVYSGEGGSQISASTISDQLNSGTSVQLTTGTGGSADGNITVSAAIEKTSGSDATLTLQAANNITINANITSTVGKLDLNLESGYRQTETESFSMAVVSSSHQTTIGNNARVVLNGGTMDVKDGSSKGNLLISNGTVDLGTGGLLTAAALQLGSAGVLTMRGSQLNVDSVNNNGTVNLLTGGSNSLSVGSGGISNNGTINVNSSASITSSGDVVNNANGKILLNAASTTLTASGNATWTNNGTLNISGVGQNLSLDGSNGLVNNGQMNLGNQTSIVSGSNSVTNNGTLTMAGATISAKQITNEANGTISGTGTLTATGSVTNNGTLAPGGDGTVGNLTINGASFTQNAAGKMLVDIVSATSYDRITFGTNSVSLGGTLKTRLIGNYVPASSASFDVFSFGENESGVGSSYFRNVTGDVVKVGSDEKMIKAVYGDGGSLSLQFRGAETFYAANSEGGWGSRYSWVDSQGERTSDTYLPTQIDTVVIAANKSASHDSGDDVIGSLQIAQGGQLYQQSGNLTVRNSSSIQGTANISVGSSAAANATTALILNGSTSGNGTLNIGDTDVQDGVTELLKGSVTIANASQSGMTVNLTAGNLTLGGDVRLSNLTVSDGTVTGNTGSRLVVAEGFTQTGGNLTLADAALSQASGALAVGNITANNLVLEAQSGNVSQNSGTSLRVKQQLIAAATTGIKLSNSGNQVAGFAANNNGTGDISLTNSLNTSDASVVSINGVSTTRGNISIDNTGGAQTTAIGSSADFLGSLPTSANGTVTSAASKLSLLGINTTGQVKSSNGSVSLVTHSPLTIGSGGVSATGSITLTAGASSGSNDTLIVNGVLVSTGGNITLSAGDSMTINANISTSPPGVALLSVDSGAVIGYAQGVTITDVNGTRTPVSGSGSSATSQTAQAVQQQQNQQSQSLQTTLNNAQLSDSAVYHTGDVLQQNNANGQTVGGTADNFGDEGGDRKQVKKPLPMCT